VRQTVLVAEAVAERVSRLWGQVLAWCRGNAPATAAVIRGPADERALSDAQAEMGMRWPEELLAWLRLSNGVDPSLDGQMLPVCYAPLGADQIVEDWKRLTSYPIPAEDILAAAAQPAGSDWSAFSPSWIPIAADFCGGYLFVDLRSGPRHGCIGDYDKVEGFFAPPVWDGIGDMLDSVAFALSSTPGDTDHDAFPTAGDHPTPQMIRLTVVNHEPPDPAPAGRGLTGLGRAAESDRPS